MLSSSVKSIPPSSKNGWADAPQRGHGSPCCNKPLSGSNRRMVSRCLICSSSSCRRDRSAETDCVRSAIRNWFFASSSRILLEAPSFLALRPIRMSDLHAASFFMRWSMPAFRLSFVSPSKTARRHPSRSVLRSLSSSAFRPAFWTSASACRNALAARFSALSASPFKLLHFSSFWRIAMICVKRDSMSGISASRISSPSCASIHCRRD